MKENYLNKKKYKDLGRWYINNFVLEVAKRVEHGCRILDVGAGECVYKQFV